jgi:hypothetical protein
LILPVGLACGVIVVSSKAGETVAVGEIGSLVGSNVGVTSCIKVGFSVVVVSEYYPIFSFAD